MRNNLIVFLWIVFASFDAVAEPIEFESLITDVVVYRNGVRITREANVNISSGQSEIVFSNLTTQINPHSLQVQVPDGVDLVTAHYKTDFLKNIELPERVQKINAEIELLNMDVEWNNKQLDVYTREEQILAPKQFELTTYEKGLTVEDLKEYTNYYRERSLDIKKKQLELNKENKKIQAKIADFRNELNELQGKKNQKTGEVIFIVQSNSSKQFDLSFSFISNQAGWEPVYDLKAVNTHSPMVLNLKANVYQNTGIDWKYVKMAISTGNPLLGNDRPILRPKYITFAPVYSSVGQRSTSNIAYDMMELEKVSVTSVGANSVQQPQISDTEITREYLINQTQSVPSSGLKRLVQLQRYEIDAKYKHHSVPKMDNGVFLLAQVPNWGQYNLLPGIANIFFQNTYIGQSAINSNVTTKNILLSLGRDESVKIQREQTNYLEETKFLGTNQIRNMEYTITVKNTKNRSINIEILDQIPISQHEDIKIELKKMSGADFNEETGGLKWQLDLKPGQSKKLVFNYTQKSPKGKAVAVN